MACNTDEQQYLHNHWLLRRAWQAPEQYFFAFLKPDQQWHLHEYFLPTKDLTDDRLLEYRQQLLKEQPAARERGQQALVIFHKHAKAHAARLLRAQTNRRGPVFIFPDPNSYDLAYALRKHILEVERKRRQRSNNTDSPPL